MLIRGLFLLLFTLASLSSGWSPVHATALRDAVPSAAAAPCHETAATKAQAPAMQDAKGGHGFCDASCNMPCCHAVMAGAFFSAAYTLPHATVVIDLPALSVRMPDPLLRPPRAA